MPPSSAVSSDTGTRRQRVGSRELVTCITGPPNVAPVGCLLPINSRIIILNHMVQYSPDMDSAFTAVGDPTRRGILERLGRRSASISELAEAFDMTLTGMKKHVALLEDVGLVRTEKIGRVRTCRLGPRTLAREAAWIARYQEMLEGQMDRLEAFLDRTKGEF